MVDALLSSLLPAFLGGLFLSFCIEQMLRPRPLIVGRPCAAFAVHAGVWTLAFAAELLLMRRPYFAAGNVLALEMVVVVVSNAKHGALREPFVYPDFEYFLDAIKHPRLYLPFIGVWAVVLPLVGYILICVAAFRYEPSLLDGPGGAIGYATAVAGLLFTGLALCRAGRQLRPTFDASADLAKLGLLASLYAYGRAERTPPELAQHSGAAWPELPSGQQAPDLVSIQSESFFDARRTYPALRDDLLTGFDRLRKEALAHGDLTVPAWGANTVRSEFAFLCGQSQQTLGVHRYNPYRRLEMSTVPSLARHLKRRGYRSVCIHPYHASFYRRDDIMPRLGFDEFIDLSAFSDADRQGPYVGDKAVAEKVIEILRRSAGGPLYIHVITMENHGPLHWEAVGPEDAEAVASLPLPANCRDLVAYARHLRNADAMFERIAGFLKQHDRSAGLCIYGDHVPIMADVYRSLGEPDGTTPYLIWHNRHAAQATAQAAALDDLAGLWLQRCYLP